MVLSDVEIKGAMGAKELKLDPFSEECLNPAGYDLRCGSKVVIPPRSHRLLVTLEKVELGADLVGIMFIRSSFAREGLVASLAVVDPGFRGNLTLSAYNGGRKRIVVEEGEGIVQLVLLRLRERASRLYAGAYQDSSGIVQRRRRKRGIKSGGRS